VSKGIEFEYDPTNINKWAQPGETVSSRHNEVLNPNLVYGNPALQSIRVLDGKKVIGYESQICCSLVEFEMAMVSLVRNIEDGKGAKSLDVLSIIVAMVCKTEEDLIDVMSSAMMLLMTKLAINGPSMDPSADMIREAFRRFKEDNDREEGKA
jgi:hypothetical protein